MKKAVISLDFEDWYHLEYFKNSLNDKSQKYLDEGTNEFINIITKKILKLHFLLLENLFLQN